MADATVLNTVGLCPCGFESRLRHFACVSLCSRSAIPEVGGDCGSNMTGSGSPPDGPPLMVETR